MSIGTSAALLASLFATAAAPVAQAAYVGGNSSSGFSTIHPGETTAVGTLTFGEDNNNDGQFANEWSRVYAYDSSDTQIDFAATTPTVTINEGDGVVTALINSDGGLWLHVTGMRDDAFDKFTIGNLKLASASSTTTGFVTFSVENDNANLGAAHAAVPVHAYWDYAQSAGSDTSRDFTYYQSNEPDFDESYSSSGSVYGGWCKNSDGATLEATTPPAEEFSILGVSGGTLNADLLYGHAQYGDLSQTVCVQYYIAGPEITDAISLWNDGMVPNVQAGTANNWNSQPYAQMGFDAGLMRKGKSFTATITTAGVTWSPRSLDTYDGQCELNASGSAVTCTLDHNTVADETFDLPGEIDVAQNVPNGTAVKVELTNDAGKAVTHSPITIAYVGMPTSGVTANPTNVIIGQNLQALGVVTITERYAGAVQYGVTICLRMPWSESVFSSGRLPYLVVTDGDLRFNIDGLKKAYSPMHLDGTCIHSDDTWADSTVASTLQLVDGNSAGPNTGVGAKVDVALQAVPGSVLLDVFTGKCGGGAAPTPSVTIEGWEVLAFGVLAANRVYSGTPVATVSGQSTIYRGGTGQSVGSITVTEGAPNQFTFGFLRLCLRDNASAEQVHWSTPTGANQPVLSATNGFAAIYIPEVGIETHNVCLGWYTDWNSIDGLGRVTLSNLHVDVQPDAPLGPIMVRVEGGAMGPEVMTLDGDGPGPLPQSQIDQTVSPAAVKNITSINAKTAKGDTEASSAFSTTWKTVARSSYVTWRFAGGAAVAGKRLVIQMSVKKANGKWSVFAYKTGVYADSSGVAYYTFKPGKAGSYRIRVYFAGNGYYTPAYSLPRYASWK